MLTIGRVFDPIDLGYNYCRQLGIEKPKIAVCGLNPHAGENGLFGDSGPVGEDVQELREFFGPGWRMYFIKLDEVFVFMLYGGDKSSQVADIAIAKQLARNLKGCLQ